MNQLQDLRTAFLFYKYMYTSGMPYKSSLAIVKKRRKKKTVRLIHRHDDDSKGDVDGLALCGLFNCMGRATLRTCATRSAASPAARASARIWAISGRGHQSMLVTMDSSKMVHQWVLSRYDGWRGNGPRLLQHLKKCIRVLSWSWEGQIRHPVLEQILWIRGRTCTC